MKVTQTMSCAAFVVAVSLGWLNHTSAQQVQQTAQQPMRTSGIGEVNVKSSRVFTLVKGTGMGHSHGMEAGLSSGHLTLGATTKAGQLVFNMNSFAADTELARKMVGLKGTTAGWMQKQVTKEMHGPKILNSVDFPTAVFDIESCQLDGIDAETGVPKYRASGNFTLRGQTNAITVPITVDQEKGWLRVTGRFTFKQSDYGIKPLSKGFGAIGVADDLTVIGDLWIEPTPDSLASIQSAKVRR